MADKLGLPEFLGMDQAEYASWVKEPDALAQIIARHAGAATGKSVPDASKTA